MEISKTLLFADTYNVRIKKHPNGNILEILSCNRPIWSDGETHNKDFQKKKKRVKNQNTDVSSSIRRAKHKIYDYIICNDDLDLFVTLTLNQDCINRYDYKEIIRKLNCWLDNRVRRKGLKYILVPELHKDGAIHFHGFFNKSACKLTDSNHKYKDNRVIYNLEDWTLGFTTAIDAVGSRAKIGNYICKYITKQIDSGRIGGRYYLSGGNLATPFCEYISEDFCEFLADVDTFEIDNTNLLFKKVDYTQHIDNT